ncbi:MAG TPA: signal peptide peptidase SppA [Lentisphaeria bacterium]|nr:MAG: hypothetical protein A2X48_15610 [Lentisphaerae bacterium GWF2_49_21]HBC85351.1 signal peptide peptidase SppA [Lentisphaeria bacterium]
MSENSNIGQTLDENLQHTPLSQQPEPGKSRKGCLVLGIVLSIFLLVAGSIAAVFAIGFYIAGSLFSGVPEMTSFEPVRNKFVEEMVEGNYFASKKIVIIDVKGIILNADETFYQIANSTKICEQLEQARKDSRVKAVILRLDTPGGEVTAADMIHHKVMQLRDNEIKVVSYMESMAASGGYYIAVASDYIIAHRLTTTGSIGVIIETMNYQKLFNKIGVQSEVYKSGVMKDMLSGARERTDAEKQLAQDLIMEIYNEFANIVAEGRKAKNITVEKIKTTEIGDGRIFSGMKAKELGLVDELGFFEDAVSKANELAGLEGDFKVVTYKRVFTLADIFMGAKGPENKVRVEMPGMKSWTNLVEPGKVYLLPSGF